MSKEIYTARISFYIGRFALKKYVSNIKHYLFSQDIEYGIDIDKGWPTCWVYIEFSSDDLNKLNQAYDILVGWLK